MAIGRNTARGYGHAHQQLRAALLPHAPGTPCTRCGQTLREDDQLDLDHNDDRTGYTGFAHAACNRTAGAARAHTQTHPGLGTTSRDW